LIKINRYLGFMEIPRITWKGYTKKDGHKVTNKLKEISALLTVEGNDPSPQKPEKNYFIFFNITFIQGSGDLMREVPDIPG